MNSQERLWVGKFGDRYSERNSDPSIINSNLVLFKKILSSTGGINSVIEFGSNIGLNLVAIKQLLPDAEISAIEINSKAAAILNQRGFVKVYNQSIFDFDVDSQRDFVFSKGVLIHINPDMLNKVYELLYQTSKKYIAIAEYYNPTPLEVPYRLNTMQMFKRDFAGEMLERYPDLKLIDYGFVYGKDPEYLSWNKDTTWFLMEKDVS